MSLVVVAPAGLVVPPAPPRLRTVLRHLTHSLLVATVVPAGLFYGFLTTVGVTAALVAALTWCYAAVAWRLLTRRPMSGLLVLTVVVLTLRTGFALASGSTFWYFLQPVLSDSVVATAFLVSLLGTRPIVARVAADFYPMSPDVAGRASVQELFRRLTLMWGLVCVVKAAVSWWLLQSLSVASFVLVKNAVVLTLTAATVVVTVLASVAVARREGLLPERVVAVG